MNKLLLTASALFIAIGANAQKDLSKKVESKYISLPSYDISQIDPSTVGIEFAMKEATFGTEKLKDAKSTCIPAGGKLKDAVEVTSYYFEIPYTHPESYIIAKSTDGSIVYAEKASKSEANHLKFGWDETMKQPKCEYFKSDKLKKDFASKGTSFKSKAHSKHEGYVFTKALEEATANVYLSYFKEEFQVYGAKGKAFDYTDIEGAFEKAMAAYKSIKKNGLNTADINKLKEAIVVWEKELETADLENKKARISPEIAKGLHENCARAYAYMFEFDKAKEHGKTFLKLFGNFSNNRSKAMKSKLVAIELQRLAAEKNSAIIGDISALHGKASESGKSVNSKRLSSDQFDRLKGEYYNYGMAVASDVNEVKKQEEEEAIASGELNPYQKFYSDVAVGGPAILMTMPPSALSGIPEITELPSEFTEFPELAQIVIRNNKITSFSPDFVKLTNLKKLDLTGNQLTTIPAEIGQLKNLQTLILTKNPLESIPAEIANCTKLKSLVLKGTKISDSDIETLQGLLPNCKIKN